MATGNAKLAHGCCWPTSSVRTTSLSSLIQKLWHKLLGQEADVTSCNIMQLIHSSVCIHSRAITLNNALNINKTLNCCCDAPLQQRCLHHLAIGVKLIGVYTTFFLICQNTHRITIDLDRSQFLVRLIDILLPCLLGSEVRGV